MISSEPTPTRFYVLVEQNGNHEETYYYDSTNGALYQYQELVFNSDSDKTKDAIEREIYEELGWKLEFEFVGISEEFLLDMNEKTQIFNVIYKSGF